MDNAEFRGSRVTIATGAETFALFPVHAEVGWLAVIAAVEGPTTGGAIEAPEGWVATSASTRNDLGGESGSFISTVNIFYKMLDAADITAGGVTLSWGSIPDTVAIVHLFSNVDSAQPLDVTLDDPQAADGTTIELANSGFLMEGSLLLAFYGSDSGVTITPPAAMTVLHHEQDAGGTVTLCTAIERCVGTPARVGARDATTNVSQRGVSWVAAVRSAPPAAEVEALDERDLYKSILLRRSLPRSYDRSRDTPLADVLAILGESDNAIGGLFGRRNFLDPSPVAVFAQPRLVASATATVDGTSLVFTVPEEVREGHTLLVVYGVAATSGSIIASVLPSGWTNVSARTTSPARLALLRATAPASVPATYTFSVTSAVDAVMAGVLLVYEGLASNPIADLDIVANVTNDIIAGAAGSQSEVAWATKSLLFATQPNGNGYEEVPNVTELANMTFDGSVNSISLTVVEIDLPTGTYDYALGVEATNAAWTLDQLVGRVLLNPQER
jgi:hypothetical protein